MIPSLAFKTFGVEFWLSLALGFLLFTRSYPLNLEKRFQYTNEPWSALLPIDRCPQKSLPGSYLP